MGKFLLILALQTCLDRAGFSPNAIDGEWGRKSQVALATYCAVKGVPVPPSPEAAFEAFFRKAPPACTTVEVTAADVAALVRIPARPEDKAKLRALGYETLQEMFAERGHLSETALKRLNPTLPWPNPPVGAKVRIPYFPKVDSRAARANALRVSLSRREITVFDAQGNFLLLLPCSIAEAASMASLRAVLSATISNSSVYRPYTAAPSAATTVTVPVPTSVLSPYVTM